MGCCGATDQGAFPNWRSSYRAICEFPRPDAMQASSGVDLLAFEHDGVVTARGLGIGAIWPLAKVDL